MRHHAVAAMLAIAIATVIAMPGVAAAALPFGGVSPLPPLPRPAPRPTGWRDAGLPAIRGMTIGPIENALHPGVGYGSAACGRSLDATIDLGATWVAFTPFGRMWSTRTTAIDLAFETPFEGNVEAVGKAIDQAHARGLRVMLVPHLWVEAGGWRGEIEPGAPPDVKRTDGGYDFRGRATDAAMRAFAASYRRFVLAWADVARAHDVEVLSVGVELRSWLTSARATEEGRALVRDVRARYPGILTYSANWDDVDDVVLLREIDVVGINAFYPLADKAGAGRDELLAGGTRVGAKVQALADAWGKPVMFSEVGYTTRPDPAVRPWEWPDTMKGVKVDEDAQADAYRAILAGVIDEPGFAGFFVWRQFADADDVSQEAAWGFPVRGKLAELTVREVFASRFSADAWQPAWTVLGLAAFGAPGLSWSFPKVAPWVADVRPGTYPPRP
ncbi:MAG: hypothetical protein HYV09_09905 [Deltaproteobacteria bacterium]|nr:hypothetical protein [Deltaproteobacteria bacterium]